jgi:hypothetical protein
VSGVGIFEENECPIIFILSSQRPLSVLARHTDVDKKEDTGNEHV